MARNIKPLDEFTKTITVNFDNKTDAKNFDIWTYKPLVEYLNTFNDNEYGYYITMTRQKGLFKSITHYYKIYLFKL